jgi:hypothetical protein
MLVAQLILLVTLGMTSNAGSELNPASLSILLLILVSISLDKRMTMVPFKNTSS